MCLFFKLHYSADLTLRNYWCCFAAASKGPRWFPLVEPFCFSWLGVGTARSGLSPRHHRVSSKQYDCPHQSTECKSDFVSHCRSSFEVAAILCFEGAAI